MSISRRRIVGIGAALLLAGCSGSGDLPGADAPQVLAPPDERTSATPASPSVGTTPGASRDAAEGTGKGRSPGRAERPTDRSVITAGLRSPWGMAFLPDGSALVSERDTRIVRRVWPDGRTRQVGSVPGVTGGGEGGLLGLAVAPGSNPSEVLAYYTASDGNRVVRMPWSGGSLGRPGTVLTGLPSSEIHNGGRLAFGPDGMLYVTTGDAAEPELAQDLDSLAGKILRLDLARKDLTPEDNPFSADPGLRALVWSYGHRNVQGLGWSEDGVLWASEFGQSTWDELNQIEPGGNYGWPLREGDVGDARRGPAGEPLLDPRVQWPTDQASPSGLAVRGQTVYVAALRGQRLWAVPVAGNRAGTPTQSTSDLGRLRTVTLAPDGSLWLLTSNTDGRGVPAPNDDRVLRLTFES